MRFASTVAFDDLVLDEEIHQDFFVDLLDSLITRRGGTYRAVAAQAGVNPRYLRMIRDQERRVAPPTLDKIIDALPRITPTEARALRERAQHARPRAFRLGNAQRVVMDADRAVAELRRLLDLNHAALHAELRTGETAQTAWRQVRHRVNHLVAGIQNLDDDPITATHLHILLCNVLNMVDDPAGALRAARFGRAIVERHRERGAAITPRLEELGVEAIRAEAMSFHNLGQERLALERYVIAERMLAARPLDPQRTYVALSRVSSLVETRRFRISDIQRLVEAVYRACDQGLFSELEAPLLVWRAKQGLVRAYIRHQDMRRRTGDLLLSVLDDLPNVRFAGPIHRVQLYRVAAEHCAAVGDEAGREEFLRTALREAMSAGLDHQRSMLEMVLEPSGAVASTQRI